MKRYLAFLLLLVSLALICFAAYVTYDSIVGAFGSGPPYYGQTTNMDKWQNPIPYLAALDIVVLAVVFLLSRWALRLWRAGES